MSYPKTIAGHMDKDDQRQLLSLSPHRNDLETILASVPSPPFHRIDCIGQQSLADAAKRWNVDTHAAEQSGLGRLFRLFHACIVGKHLAQAGTHSARMVAPGARE